MPTAPVGNQLALQGEGLAPTTLSSNTVSCATDRSLPMSFELTIYTPDRDKLRRLDAKEAARFFKALLYADAGRMRLEEIRITTDETDTADGGVDAYARERDQPGRKGVRFFFQLKAGASFKPWQEGMLKKELFGSTKSKPSKQALGSSVKDCLDSHGVYVLVCFGHDLQDNKAKLAANHLRRLFSACGYRNAKVQVWGLGELAGMAEQYPSLCMDLNERSLDGQLMTFKSWAENADMRLPMVWSDEAKKTAARIAALVAGDAIQHVRLIGEPGLGKTRLALEALRADPRYSAAVIYAPQPTAFQTSRLFSELLKADRAYQVVLVVDECDERERSSIFWNLRGRPGIKLITIDHGPESSSDERMEVLPVPLLSDEQVHGILAEYVPAGTGDLFRWARWCEGSARVAHALGENLRSNPGDLLRPPASVDIWGRFIHGYEDPRDRDQTATVLEHIALFRKFGFRHPVQAEGRFIASLAAQVDPSITYGRFSRIVSHLRDKRVLQGDHTLRIVPKALHLYLWRQWWMAQGVTADLGEVLTTVPESLRRWFSDMLIYANGVEPAREAIRRTFGANFNAKTERDLVTTSAGAEFLAVLAEADPETATRVFVRAISALTGGEIESLGDTRQTLVHALCKLAVHRTHFSEAAKLLVKLSNGDDSTYSNNSSGSFAGLFSLNGGPTQATPMERLALIEELFQGSDLERSLALRAVEQFLETHGRSRIVGVEHQGLQQTLEFWKAIVWNDLYGPWRAALKLLEGQASVGDAAWQLQASGVLIDRADGFLSHPELKGEALEVLRRKVDREGSDLRKLTKLLIVHCRRNYRGLPVGIIDDLRSILDVIGSGSFERRFQRFVCFSDWEEDLLPGKSGDELPDPTTQERLAALASELIQTAEAQAARLTYIHCAEGHRIRQFGADVARQAPSTWDDLVFNTAQARSEDVNAEFLSGYMSRLWVSDPKRWEKLALTLIAKPRVEWRARAALGSGVTRKLAKTALDLVAKGSLEVQLLQLWSYVPESGAALKQDEFESLLASVLKIRTPEASWTVVNLGGEWVRFRKRPLSTSTLWKLISSTAPHAIEAPYNSSWVYRWRDLVDHYRKLRPGDDLRLFSCLLMAGAKSGVGFKAEPFELAAEIAKGHRKHAWAVVAKLIEDPAAASNLADWLGDDFRRGEDGPPISIFDPEDVLAWIAEKQEPRAALIAGLAPKTLDTPAGALTLGVLERFGADTATRNALHARFWTGVIHGPVSVAHAEIRDRARAWQGKHTNPNVRRWTQELIDSMNDAVERERIQEERGF